MSLLLIYGCNLSEEDVEIIESSTNDYELLYDYNSEHILYIKRHLVDFFLSVTIGAEYGSNFPLVKKWNQPMRVLIEGDPDSILLQEIDTIIRELNMLATDGFFISIGTEVDYNFVVHIGDADSYINTYPEVRSSLQDNSGFFWVHTDSDFYITDGHMFVDNKRLFGEEQKHMLREELTQALGMPNDIRYYPHSIFYSDRSLVTEYSHTDREVIRLLYHPKMIAGIGETSTQSILESILGI